MKEATIAITLLDPISCSILSFDDVLNVHHPVFADYLNRLLDRLR